MAFELTLRFGGLCLFVQQEYDEPKGLFVLMPVCTGHAHTPMLVYDAKYVKETSGERRIKRFGGTAVSLRNHGLTPPGAKRKFPDELANITTLSGRNVAARWLTEAPSSTNLAARVEFDLLPNPLIAVGDIAKMKHTKDDKVRPPVEPELEVAGQFRTVVMIDRQDLPIDDVGLTFYPQKGIDANGKENDVMTLCFLNVPEGDLGGAPGTTHGTNKRAEHFDAHYALFDPAGVPEGQEDKLIPRLRMPHEVKAHGDFVCESGYRSVGKLRPEVPIAEPRFIDPVRCSGGGGCGSEGC